MAVVSSGSSTVVDSGSAILTSRFTQARINLPGVGDVTVALALVEGPDTSTKATPGQNALLDIVVEYTSDTIGTGASSPISVGTRNGRALNLMLAIEDLYSDRPILQYTLYEA